MASDRRLLLFKPTRASASLWTINASLRSTVSGVFQIGQVHDRISISDSGKVRQCMYGMCAPARTRPPPPGAHPRSRAAVCAHVIPVTLRAAADADGPSLPPTCPAFDDSLGEQRHPTSPSIHCRTTAACQRDRMIRERTPYFLYRCPHTSAAGAANRTKLRTPA